MKLNSSRRGFFGTVASLAGSLALPRRLFGAQASQPPPKLSVTSFIAFGDSITAGEDGQNPAALANPHIFVLLPDAEQYPSVLQAEFGHVTRRKCQPWRTRDRGERASPTCLQVVTVAR